MKKSLIFRYVSAPFLAKSCYNISVEKVFAEYGNFKVFHNSVDLSLLRKV